jgi:nucleotide-binding universal stress UspA family protein
MHTILIPYDFSLSANNAAEYALSIFKNRATRFIFVHVMPEGEDKDVLTILNQLKSDTNSMANEKAFPHHTFEERIVHGEVIERLASVADVLNVDAIFMGTKGNTDIRSRLMGTNTAGLLEKSRVPVMVIPKRARYGGFRRMVLGTDYRPVLNFDSYDYMLKLLQLSNAEFIVLNVENENEPVTMERTMAGITMERAFANRPHRYEFVHHESRVQGILEYVSKNDVDLLAMLKRDHYILSNALEDSVVSRTLLEIEIPLLSLPLMDES